MKRVVATLVAVTVGLAACGGDDDTDAAAEPSTTSAGDADAGGAADDVDTGDDADDAGDDADAGDAADDAADDADADDADIGGDGSGSEISSLDDIPSECRDLVAEFLGDLEPIVEPIDWRSASLTDFEQIALDFEEIGSEYEARSSEAGCDDLTFADDADFELVIELAEDEAPGIVPFFEYLAGLAGAFGDGDAEADGGPEPVVPGGEFADCDEAMEFVEGLTEDYDSVQDVPVSELAKIAGLGAVLMSCTPEQLEFFDSPEIAEFMGG